MSFLGLLTLLFIALKLIGIINWSWLLVLSPIIFVIVLWLIILAVTVMMEDKARSRRKNY